MTIAAGMFKQKCLQLMERVRRTHEEIVITKRGKPIARLAPFNAQPSERLLGFLAGQAEIKGDIVSPLKVHWSYDADNL